ncbi:MAG: hypothetical protein ACJA1Z_000402 [Patiriisocius sp.]|jgi:hypothetical protein
MNTLNYFPKSLNQRIIGIYFISLILIGVAFPDMFLKWYWVVIGIFCVTTFFHLSSKYSYSWQRFSPVVFKRKLFRTALAIRIFFVFFSYWFFTEMTGQPFEFAAGDSIGYHEEGSWIVDLVKYNMLDYYFAYIDKKGGVSDLGYPGFLGIQYLITNKSIIIARIIKAILSSYTCVLVYKLASRNFGEATGRVSSIFVMLMPSLVMYCGLHLKETEMIFLIMAFVERADNLLRSKVSTFKNIFVVLCLIGLLFMFRTVLGIGALFSLVSTILLSKNLKQKSKKYAMVFWVILTVVSFSGSRLVGEVEKLWDDKATNQSIRLEDRAKKGNVYATYAGAFVFAPMIFTLPFPTMIETQGQETFRLLHGGVFVKNIISFFTILALFLLVKKKLWRNHLLIITFLAFYLAVLAVSAFAHSERFHLPAVPLELILAGYGITHMQAKHRNWFNYWTVLILVAVVAWSWFKLKGRGVV